jgi:hypothetical protein
VGKRGILALEKLGKKSYIMAMNTDNNTEQQIRQIKRAMFWRLYTLPWIILTVFLVALVVISPFHKPNPVITTNVVQNCSCGTMYGHNPIITNKIVYTKPISYASNFALLNDDLNVVKSNQNYLIKEFSKARKEISGVGKAIKPVESSTIVYTNNFEGNTKSVKEQGEEFSSGDYLLAERIGYNLEEELVKNIQGLITYEMSQWDGTNRVTLQIKLRKGSERIIKDSFDGFKTYNRLKK